jgi:hypothetical protein
MDAGAFAAYFAIGKRNYTGTPPTALASYTTLITSILYYRYDGLNLTVRYSSANLPADDGLIIGDKYYFERGIVGSTIKTASLRFDDYSITKNIITAMFSLFSPDERPATIAGDDTYTNVLTALNPNDYWLGTLDFKATPENASHWGYQFYPAGRNVILKSYASLLPLIRQKYLIQAVDGSDDSNENEIQFYHLNSPVSGLQFQMVTSGLGSIWNSVCWSPELSLFVAVGYKALASYRIMTSPDGSTWTGRTSPAGNPWYGVCWSPELSLFVAVSYAGKAATSPDGITWTERTVPNSNTFSSVCWSPALSLFVAVSSNSVGLGGVLTSPNGITWTERTPAAALGWSNVIWVPELALFVAIGLSGTNRVMTSPDGITWTIRTTPGQAAWYGLAWAPELSLLVAVGARTGANYIMTSPDGITWTARTGPADVTWNSVAWSPEYALFIAVSESGVNNRRMKSYDGIVWTIDTDASTNYMWKSIVWSPERSQFVAVANDDNVSDPGVLSSVLPNTTDHTITQGDITLLKDGPLIKFLWRDESSVTHTSGAENSIIHNLGYLESTALPPASYQNADRATAIVGIHLKYKSGDYFTLRISATQTATYIGEVTEILEPKAEIAWRNEIRLIERLTGNEGSTLPSTIEAAAPYTPLVTGTFNGILSSSANNIQAAMEMIDDHTHDTSHTHEVDQRADVFSDGEGDPAAIGTAADGTSTYAARRDHVHAITSLPARQKLGWTPYGALPAGMTGDGTNVFVAVVDRTYTFVNWTQGVRVSSPNNGTNYWKIRLFRLSDGATVNEIDTSAISADAWASMSDSSFSIASIGTAGVGVYINILKQGTPGDISMGAPDIEVSI